MAVGTLDSELRLAQEIPLNIPPKTTNETRLDTLLVRLDANKGVVFSSIVLRGRDGNPSNADPWFAVAPIESIYHPRNMEVFAERLLTGLYPNQHGRDRDLTNGYWNAVRYGFTDPDAIAHTTDSKTTKPELFKTFGLTEHTESTSSRGVLLTFYPNPLFADRAIRDRTNQMKGVSVENPDLANGYLLERWIENSKKGLDPFTEPPSFTQKLLAALRRS